MLRGFPSKPCKIWSWIPTGNYTAEFKNPRIIQWSNYKQCIKSMSEVGFQNTLFIFPFVGIPRFLKTTVQITPPTPEPIYTRFALKTLYKSPLLPLSQFIHGFQWETQKQTFTKTSGPSWNMVSSFTKRDPAPTCALIPSRIATHKRQMSMRSCMEARSRWAIFSGNISQKHSPKENVFKRLTLCSFQSFCFAGASAGAFLQWSFQER